MTHYNLLTPLNNLLTHIPHLCSEVGGDPIVSPRFTQRPYHIPGGGDRGGGNKERDGGGGREEVRTDKGKEERRDGGKKGRRKVKEKVLGKNVSAGKGERK